MILQACMDIMRPTAIPIHRVEARKWIHSVPTSKTRDVKGSRKTGTLLPQKNIGQMRQKGIKDPMTPSIRMGLVLETWAPLAGQGSER
jgi:hypothetical protein